MKKCPVPLSLQWSHVGAACRVTPWPEVRFEQVYGDEWIEAVPTEAALASAAQSLDERAWQAYLQFVPAPVRAFLEQFSFMRIEALQVIARCPALLGDLMEVPPLTGYLAAHVTLRGTAGAAWNEIGAVHERAGVFGVMEWLGLPASRQTLQILARMAEPDVPKRLLEPLRTLLWDPQAIFALQRMPAISERQLTRFCHALAA